MLKIRTIVASLVAAGVAVYAIEHFGFAIAHSAALMGITALIAPGVLIAFFSWMPGDWVPIFLALVVNALYYYFIALLWRRSRTAAEM